MSGIVETIVGVAGLAPLTIQIVENIQKIQELYSAIKNAPQNVQFLLVELELLGNVLAGYTSQRYLELPSSSREEAMIHCRTSLDHLQSIVAALETGFRTQQRPWAAIKATFQRKKLEDLLTRIERAKSTLVLAQLQYLHAIFQACARGDDILVQQLIDGGMASPFDIARDGITPLHVAAAFQRPNICQKLISMGANIHASRWGGILQETPLHLASDMDTPYMLEHLVPEVPDYLQSQEDIRRIRRIHMQDTIRVLVEHGSAEIDMFYEQGMSVGTARSLLHCWRGFSEEFLWLASEERLSLIGVELQEFYFSIAQESSVYHEIEIIDLAIEKVSDLPRLAQERIAISDWTILHCYLGHNWTSRHRKPPSIPLGAVERVVDAGADIHALDSLHRTPLMVMAWEGLVCIYYTQLDETLRDTIQSAQEMEETKNYHTRLLNQWLSFLERKGFDLNEYLRKEKELGADRWIELCEDSWAGIGASRAKGEWFVRIAFGNHLETGNLEVHFEYETRERNLRLPGAWEEDVNE